MRIARVPSAPLRPFVRELWLTDQRSFRSFDERRREVMLPSGNTQIAFRLSDAPLRLLEPGPGAGSQGFVGPVVAGPRSTAYVKCAAAASYSIGAELRPGATRALLDASALALADRHVKLSDFWGTAAGEILMRLQEASTPARALDALEAAICERIGAQRALHPAIDYALARLAQSDRVDAVVRDVGFSHRHFCELFKHATGLTPKRYFRVKRFQRAQGVAFHTEYSLARIAAATGFSDESHLIRDFADACGMTPTAYRKLARESAHGTRVASSARMEWQPLRSVHFLHALTP